ncbi:TPA: hypothetical protein ACSP8J_004040 [Aeromonas veronii]|uniref:hypothetical protein n=1 Tax=Aeromonas TaxID=642 RepID=UPI00191D5562|nr:MULTISPECIES: hypothetical protein [Aeromonas]MBL0632993.1 hypothetical protein [Aeromonas veronii]MCX4046920.1 hypothetical protein [Aeromonas veronii]WRT75382.1 hypothetical protein VK677_13730 [Aeromonas dhakensis]
MYQVHKILFILLVAFFLNGCEIKTIEQKNIDLVKESLFIENIKVNDLARDLVAIDGQIAWKSFISKSDQHIVELEIKRKIKSKNKMIRMQWKVNPLTKYVELSYCEYDGKPTSRFIFLMQIIEWAL